MKTLLSTLTVLYTLCPALGYYLNDDNPKLGFISVDNAARNFVWHGMRGMQKKLFSSSQQTNNDKVVDSHFKLVKSGVNLPYTQAASAITNVQNTRMNTEAPSQRPANDNVETNSQQEPTKNQEESVQTHPNAPQPASLQSEYINAPQPYKPNYPNRHELKANIVPINTNQVQVSIDQQRVKLNNNRQLPPMALHRSSFPKMATTSLIEKSKQKTSKGNRNYQTMLRVLEDMTHNVQSRRQRADYKKRDTDKFDGEITKHNSQIDNMKKYFVGKDKNLNFQRKTAREYSRIGSNEELMETEDSPYAIFYRMHPDNLDEHKTYLPAGSTEVTDFYNNNKQKGLSSYESYVDLSRPTNNYLNSVKTHKKIKNYSNYRSNNV